VNPFRTLFVTAAFVPVVSLAQDTATTVRFGGFVDTYVAFDGNRPRGIDRAFTTQPARHAEFNLNLAHVEAVLAGPRVRGRVALQAGTSVQANYAGEPALGAYSGGALARHIQEAVVGVRVGDRTWVDGGVFLSHIGSESWVSRDNPTYTRSLIADYSPYYQSGVKLTWQATPTLSVLATVVNGWQIISENNEAKSVGARVDWTPSPRFSLGYYNLFGDEQPDSLPSRQRFFNGVTAKVTPTDRWTLVGTLDVGTQETADGDATWWGGALIARVQATPRVAIVARAEAYEDADQVIIVTGGDAFRATGASLGIDVAPRAGLLWRSELRALRARDAVFPDRDGQVKGNVVVVTSLGLTF
jgi:hypothetical protein